MEIRLTPFTQVLVRQRHEIGEWLGFETRNKYEVVGPQGEAIGFAAEQQKGLLGFFMRQWLGHWRSFSLHFFSPDRQLWMIAEHPFRFIFKRLEVHDAAGRKLGAIQQRFAFMHRRFDVENESGTVVLEVSSPFWKIWTFLFLSQGRERASVVKKWSGLISEAFSDKDNFLVQFTDPALPENTRRLVLAAALFIDLRYFERKAGKRSRF